MGKINWRNVLKWVYSYLIAFAILGGAILLVAVYITYPEVMFPAMAVFIFTTLVAIRIHDLLKDK